MSSSVFASLGRRASQVGLLEEAEELRLIRAYKRTGDKNALHRLVEAHLGMIMGCARRSKGSARHAEDYVNEGVIGFIRAIELFDETKGARLSTIAKFHVMARMSEYALENMSSVPTYGGRNQRAAYLHMRKHMAEDVASGDRLMTHEETQKIANRLGIDSEDVTYVAQRMAGGDVSIDGHVATGSGEKAALAEILADTAPHPEDELILKDELQKNSLRMRLAMGKLPKREAFILAERRLKDPPVPLEHLAAMYGISKGRISQIEQQAITMLKEILASSPAPEERRTRRIVHRRG